MARNDTDQSTKVNEEVRKCELCGSSNWRILHEGDESNCECEGECLRVCDNPDDDCDGIATKVVAEVFRMEVVTTALTITAKDENEAEEKYDAHFNGDECPCGNKDCKCVLVSDEVYHITTGENEL